MLRERSWFRITAGQKDYSCRMKLMEQSRNEHYAGLGIPPGPPTNKGIWGELCLPAGWQETTGQALTNKTLGNYDIPDNWPRPPIKNKPGDVPGPPVQYGPAVDPNNVEPGYGFSLPLPLREDDIYFYHSDHLGSTSYVTDGEGSATQFVCYIPFGEAFVDEHSTRPGMPYKFNGKEQDAETGLLYYGARYYDAKECRWYGVDPLVAKYPSISSYVYCANNPIIFVDPDGQEPTPAEAARMAAHVYVDKKNNILTGGWQVSNRNFGIQLQTDAGLKSLVYERVVDGKVTEYTYATAGTENWQDWKENGKQPLGLSDQYHSAAENAKTISKDLGETELTYTGHSLGGGEAAINSLVTDGDGKGRRAITFNAAGVGDITKVKEGTWKTRYKSERKIDAYILRTDPLNTLQNRSPIMPDVNGKRHYLWPKDLPSTYNGHSINNIIKNFGVKNPDEYTK